MNLGFSWLIPSTLLFSYSWSHTMGHALNHRTESEVFFSERLTYMLFGMV